MKAVLRNYEDFLGELVSIDHAVAYVGSVNFEECSIRFASDLLRKVNGATRISFLPCRLESRKRTSPWSALEMVKEEHTRTLLQVAEDARVQLQPIRVQYPVSIDACYSVLKRAAECSSRVLVLDISAMPRAFACFLCDIIFGLVERFHAIRFDRVFIVDTPPERTTGRAALGPFSVGVPIGVRSHDQFWRQDGAKTSSLVFPGLEGFEARACVDFIGGVDTHTTVAFDCQFPSFPRAVETMIANQSIIDDAFDNALSLQYYFSPEDALRVGTETAERAANLAREFPDRHHAFLVAPFASKWTVAVASLVRAHYVRLVRAGDPKQAVITDTLVIPRSQYVSLHSRGSRTPHVVEVIRVHDE
jgi:hypothetical protein